MNRAKNRKLGAVVSGRRVTRKRKAPPISDARSPSASSLAEDLRTGSPTVSGNGSMRGNHGDDIPDSGAGNDSLEHTLANGCDMYIFGRGSGLDIIFDPDTLEGDVDTILLDEDVGDDLLYGSADADTLYGDDTVDSDYDCVTLSGGADDDVVREIADEEPFDYGLGKNPYPFSRGSGFDITPFGETTLLHLIVVPFYAGIETTDVNRWPLVPLWLPRLLVPGGAFVITLS